MKTYQHIKRLLDLVLAISLLVALSPFLLVVAVIIRITMGSPVIFKQVRSGLHERPFTILKFRTMINAYDKDGDLLPDKMRLNSLGRILRRTKLDELPELWNVLRNDMSLIGPRPTLLEQIKNYTEEQSKRLSVIPGMTGWAQVNGNTKLNWEDRITLDIWYINNWSLWLDFRIIIRTLKVIISGENITKEAHNALCVRRRS